MRRSVALLSLLIAACFPKGAPPPVALNPKVVEPLMCWLVPVRTTVPPLGVKVPLVLVQSPETFSVVEEAVKPPPVRVTLAALICPVEPLKAPREMARAPVLIVPEEAAL